VIRSLRLKNFRRYRDTTFDLAPGVNFIEGENNVGKTTILYAIEYALFGRVDGFRSQTALMRPGARAMGVELVFTDKAGATWRLQRVHAYPPKARKNLTGYFTLKQDLPDGESRYVLASDFDDTEDKLALALQERTGLTRRLFALAVHMKQGEIARILEGSPQLDIVLGVTAAVVAEDELRAIALELEKETAELPVLEESARRIAAETGILAERAATLAAEEAALVAQQAEVTTARQAIGGRVSALDRVVRASRALSEAIDREDRERDLVRTETERLAEIAGREGPEDDVRARIGAMEAAGATRAHEVKEINAGIATHEGSRRSFDAARGDLSGRIARRRKLPSGADARCEACGAPVDAAHNASEIAAWEVEQAGIDAEIAAADAAIRDLRARRDALAGAEREEGIAASRLTSHLADLARQRANVDKRTNALSGFAAATTDAVAGCRDAVTASHAHFPALALDGDTPRTLRDALASTLQSVRESLAAEQGRLDARADELNRSVRRAADEARTARTRLEALDREKAGIAARIDTLAAKAARADRLRRISTAFRTVQTKLRSEASATLAADTRALHQRLSGLPDEFSAVSIDPSRYSLQVVPKDVGEEVPAWLYEGGGHRLLLGLAYRLAVVRMVGSCPFILMDEPTYGLDRARLGALLERITSLGFSEQILLITHQAMGEVQGRRIRVARAGAESVQEAS
jgi:DNA repair exonuclease SbcCD ATPase subunit